MSASKFCRNFVHMGSKENSCHTTGEETNQNDDPKTQKTRDFCTAASINMEGQEHLDIPLVVIFFPGNRKKHHDDHLIESTDCNDLQERSCQTAREKDCPENPYPKIQKTQAGSSKHLASGIEFGDEVSSPENPQCSTTSQALPVPGELEVVTEKSLSSSRHSVNDPGASSSICSYVGSAELPPGSTLISDRGVFFTSNKERPFACGYCGESYTARGGAYEHIALHHDQKQRYSCPFCHKHFSRLYHLSGHMARVHTWKESLACNQRGKRSHANGGLASTLGKPNNFKRSRDTKKISNQSQGDGFQTKIVNGQRISVASDSEHEDDVSPPENSRRSTTAETLLSSETSELAEKVPHYAVNDRGTTHSLCNEAESLLSLELPPGSTMLTYYGVFRTKDKDKPFMCGYCVTSYNSYPAACSHVEMQHGEKRYCCEFCGRRYAHQCHLALHMMTHTREQIFTCDQCDLRFRFQGQLRRHALVHTEDLPFSCRICHKSFKSDSCLLKHSKIHTEEERREGVICNICKKEFSHDYDLKEHMTTHTTERNVEQKDTAASSDKTSSGVHQSSFQHTTDDNETFSSICSSVESIDTSRLSPGSTLVSDREVFQTNDKERPFAYGYCGKNYLSKQGVDAHITQHHDQSISFSCECCGKFFADQYHLSSHLKSHMQRDPFDCDKNISKEMAHSGERPFKCSCCDKDFDLEVDLQFHMITHNENMKLLLLGESHDPEEIKISEVVQLQKPALSLNNCSVLEEHLPDNAGFVESNIHPFQLEDSHTQMKPSSPKAPRRFMTSNSRALQGCTNSRLQSSLETSSDNLYNKVSSESKVPAVKESQISHIMEANSNESEGKRGLSNNVNGKPISPAAEIVYEDELSSRESSQCSTTTQTLLSEAPKEHPSSSSRQFVNHGGKSSSVRVPVQNTVSSNLPPGAVLLNYRYVFYLKGQEKPFSCGYCGKAYKTKHSAYGHVVHIHEEKRYSCEVCGKRFSQQCILASHMRVHTKEKPFACDQCGRQFRFRSTLQGHKYTHSEERLFPCEKCNKSFKTRDVLSQHSLIHQTVEERAVITCNICKKQLSVNSSLKQHMMIHSGEKPFKCSICDKQFGRSSQLQYHMNTHNGTKRFPDKSCTVCGKTISGNHMRDHMRVHSGEKPFECSICLKRFPKKQNLEGHMRSHTGEKPFACSGCDKRFALYSNMVTHKAKCTF